MAVAFGVTGIVKTLMKRSPRHAAISCIQFGCITGEISVIVSNKLLVLVVRFYYRNH